MPELSFLQRILDNLVAEKVITSDSYRTLSGFKLLPSQTVESFLKAHSIVLNAEEITRALAKASGLPYFNLIGLDVSRAVLNIIPLEVARNYQIIAFKKEGGVLYVGFVNPQNIKALEAIDFLAKERSLTVSRFVISQDSFNHAFKQYRVLESEVSQALETAKQQFGIEGEGGVSEVDLSAEETEKVEQVLNRAPVSKIVSVIIRHAIEGSASDVHIEPMPTETRVRYRIDGILYTSIILPLYVHAALVARIKVMAKLKIDETRLPQDGRIRLVVEGKEADFRISILPLVNNEKVVMRILPVTDKAPTLSDLGFLKHDAESFKEIIDNPTGGMVIISGPTGSGKSTTLYSIISVLNREGVNIITVEDPVEYFMKGVNQAQVRPEVGFTFANALRAFLRQDPNIIMVGEVRDEETAELAIHAGLTGHLVLTTLHTNDAVGAIPRLIDMGVEPFFVASTIRLVMAQRLARKICNDCKEEIKLPPAFVKQFMDEFERINRNVLKINAPELKSPYKFFKGKGCTKCGGSGYKGRFALTESIRGTKELKEIIVGGNKTADVDKELERQNMLTMRQDGIIKVVLGQTTVDEVWRVTSLTEIREDYAGG